MNLNFDETFFLDTEDDSKECRVITTLYSEERKKYYIIYEYVEENEEIYVSSYDPNDVSLELHDITDERELESIAKFLDDYEDEE